MCVAVNGNFKVLLGHFFVTSLSGLERANVVRLSLQKVHETGAWGLSLTCDGPSCHFSMVRELGASLDPETLRPNFPHPSDSSLRVYVFLDPVHAIKLVRNCLGSEKILISPRGIIKWDFICKLQNLQEREGLRAGTKLTQKHINFEKNKMKCSLATQTLSNSVASAIDFCRDDLKLEEFKGSEATTEFIRYQLSGLFAQQDYYEKMLLFFALNPLIIILFSYHAV